MLKGTNTGERRRGGGVDVCCVGFFFVYAVVFAFLAILVGPFVFASMRLVLFLLCCCTYIATFVFIYFM